MKHPISIFFSLKKKRSFYEGTQNYVRIEMLIHIVILKKRTWVLVPLRIMLLPRTFQAVPICCTLCCKHYLFHEESQLYVLLSVHVPILEYAR